MIRPAHRKKITNQSFSIFSYSNNVEISRKICILNDILERSFIRPLKQSQFSIRSQVSYNFRKNWNGVAGVAYYLSSPNDTYTSSTLIVPEIRINQDLSYKQRFSAFSLGTLSRPAQ
jgi:hypothetical protein